MSEYVQEDKGNCYWMAGKEMFKVLCGKKRAITKENYFGVKNNGVHIRKRKVERKKTEVK